MTECPTKICGSCFEALTFLHKDLDNISHDVEQSIQCDANFAVDNDVGIYDIPHVFPD